MVLEFLTNFYDVAGKYDNKLALASIKILTKVHNCIEMWEHFLKKLEDDDKKISVWTSYVFKDHSLAFPDFVETKYLPALLAIADKEQFILERMESIQSGLSLLKLH